MSNSRSTAPRRAAPRQMVLRKYPLAFDVKAKDTGNWMVFTGAPKHLRLAVASLQREAWKLAYERITSAHI